MKRHLKRSSFRLPSKIALVSALSMAFALLAITAVQLWLFRTNLEETLFAEQHTLAVSISKNLDQQLITLKNALISSARAVTAEDVASSEAAQKYLDTNAGLNAIFERSVFLFSPAGKLIAERPFLPHRRGEDFSWRDYHREAVRTRGPVISQPFVTTKDDHHVVIMFSTPVFSKDGSKLIATNAGSFGLTHPRLLGHIADTVIGKTGFIYLVTKEGQLIMHPDRSRLLQRAYAPGSNPAFERALNGFEGTCKTLERDGRTAIGTFTRIPSTEWILATVYPEEEAFESFNRLLRNFILIFTVSVITACTLVWFLAWGLVSKIQSKNDILRRLKSESLQQLRAKSQFFNAASHDFRQRLHGMQLLVNAAHRSGTQGAPNILARFKSALADLQRYLDNFLEITRMETISVRPSIGPVSLQDMFQRLELQFEEAALHRQIGLKFRYTAQVLNTDEKILFRILENLISNAIKFSRGKVLVAARTRQRAIEILVLDNGEGLSEADSARVFEAFVQGENSLGNRPSIGGGYGLGLSIVRHSAALLGAQVRLSSKPRHGTLVKLILPDAAA